MNREELLKNAKPILFNTEMVQAILEGRKTVTRRVVKPQPGNSFDCPEHKFIYDGNTGFYCSKCGYGVAWPHMKYPVGTSLIRPQYKVGDILYVRETWKIQSMKRFDNKVKFIFKAWGEHDIHEATVSHDKYIDLLKYECKTGWQPSLFMPKEAARIFLKVTDVRVERLQDIRCDCEVNEVALEGVSIDADEVTYIDLKDEFKGLWDSTIKKQDLDKYSWNANPWVWVIEFERVEVD